MIEQNNMTGEVEISLVELWQGIKKRLVPIILLTIALAASVTALSYFLITPKYEAQATVIVGKNKSDTTSDTLQYNDVLMSQRLVDTYTVIMESQSIREQIVDDLDLNVTSEDLKDMISINPVKDTEIIQVTVKDTIPERAMDIANQSLEIFEQEIQSIMQLDNVQVLDSARMPERPVEPRFIRNGILAGMIGLMLGVAIAVLAELMDTTIKDEDDIKNMTNIPIIGQIPFVKEL